MSLQPWLYATLAGVALVQLVVAVVAYRLRRREAATDDPDRYDGDAVECPDCGVENDRGYRFCRNCISELPGSVPSVETPSVPMGRGSA